MPKVILTIGRVFSYLVATEPHWPLISSILQNFLGYPLSYFSPKIHLQDVWKHSQFVLDQNPGHIVIGVYSWPWNMSLEDGKTWPDYPRPLCTHSFIKLGLICILHQYFTHSLYLHVYAGDTIMPPLGKTPAGAIISK